MPAFHGTWNGGSPSYTSGWLGAPVPLDPNQLLPLPAAGEATATATLAEAVVVHAVGASWSWGVGTATAVTTEVIPRARHSGGASAALAGSSSGGRKSRQSLRRLKKRRAERRREEQRREAQKRTLEQNISFGHDDLTMRAAVALASGLLPGCNLAAARLGEQMMPDQATDFDVAALLMLGVVRDASH